MKQTTLKVALGLLISAIMPKAVIAQTMVINTNSPSVFCSASTTVTKLNTAELVHFPSTTIFPGGTSIITAVAYWDGAGKFIVNDWTYGSTSVISVTGAIGVPDVAIANTGASTIFSNLVVAVAYPTSSGLKVDCYDYFDDGTSLSITLTGSHTYNFPRALGGAGTVHIDVEADYSNLVGAGLPDVRYAFVTWDNAASGLIYLSRIDLRSSGAMTATAIAQGKSPDVAGIFRGTTAPGDEIAILSYVNGANTRLFRQEYNYTTSTVSAATILDVMSAGNTIDIPRIDANDDYGTNTGSNANYYIVAEVANSSASTSEVRSYSNIGNNTPSNVVSYLPNPCMSSASYNGYAPTVAWAGPYAGSTIDGQDFDVCHFTTDGGSPSHDMVMMEPYDQTSNALISNTYYWVSEKPALSTSTGGNYASGISTPANYPPKSGIVVWAYPNGTGGSNIEYQFPSPTLVFKTPNAVKVQQPIAAATGVYPNPAHNTLNIKSSSLVINQYTITNILGVNVQNGQLGSGEVDISNMVPGSYILSFTDGKKVFDQVAFIKE